MPPIHDANILIIGGSSGIGAAVAQLVSAEQGVTVSIASSNPTRVDAAVKRIQAAVPKADVRGYIVEVSQSDVEARLKKLFSEVVQSTGRPLDHLVYTAVKIDFRFLHDVSLDFLCSDAQFLVFVPILIAKVAPEFMAKRYSSSITFTSGRLAEKPMKGAVVLGAWASALVGIVKTLALDLAPIRVNLVSPGETDTELQGSGGERAKRMAAAAETSLLGKVGTPEEVAEAYLYLMKDSNNTGSVVSSSGGRVIQ